MQKKIYLACNRGFERQHITDIIRTFITDGCMHHDAQFVSNIIDDRQPVTFAKSVTDTVSRPRTDYLLCSNVY